MAIAINGTGTITGISVGGLNDSIITSAELANAAVTAAKIGYAGAILQTNSATKTDTQSTASSSPVDITDLSVTLSVASSSNKLLITGFVVLGFYSDVNRSVVIDVNGSTVGSGAAAGSRTTAHSGGNYASADDRWKTVCAPVNYLYQCTASGSHTVKLRFFNGDTSGQSLYVNRSQIDDNASYQTRYVSTLTVSEVQG